MRRYWRKADESKPWFPWGMLQLLWLGLLLVFGALLMAPRIEADVRNSVAHRLENAGVKLTELSVDGQIISIRADARVSNKTALQTIANSTRCRTWLGELPCPTTVNVSLDGPMPASAVLTMRPHRFSIDVLNDAVTLSGEVPNLAEERRIIGVTEQHFVNITNNLSITNTPATDSYVNGTNVAIATAMHLKQGQAKWSGDVLSVLGFAGSAEVTMAKTAFDGVADDSMRGEFNVQMSNELGQCNRKFDESLTRASVRFRTSSATIDSGNETLLEKLVAIAKNCPGNLTIEGHTDSRGTAEMNKFLSEARASAVLTALQSRGIDAKRMNAIGYGEERPIADNNSSIGRAENRRIAITVQETE